ncbi:SRPBCC family protein [Chondromyces apiculatus]|uniref:Activator of Hsp90 ATPase homologue 1/2-like C-terminal domain-containing protein n=1 Tax=Chondromyces apiculatus DSM 436 TaxID=1192034 RepID=A0A017T1M3_9BACT|nr:SRPBCC domain-containing protein [Chondromyces apiculatus]EYF03108.1 Hypothetical protein CAP_6222 [Chondromyces apiculatus DSM 436]
MSTEKNLTARVTHRFSASPERVFEAWLDPEKVKVWMGAPGSNAGATEVMGRVEVDARLGGSFTFVVRRDGEDIAHVGEYLEFDRPRRLVFTWAIPQYSPDKDRVSVDIAPDGSGCEVTLTCEMHPSWAEYLERTEKAWGLMLGAMEKALG